MTPDFNAINVVASSPSAKTLTEWVMIAFALAGGKLPKPMINPENITFKPKKVQLTNLFSPK